MILTNGEHSEKNYFELLKSKLHTYYSINVKFENADPLGLVEKAIVISPEYNRVWCVFDVDDFQTHDKVRKAVRLAQSSENINIACSNRAFEVWLLNHYHAFRSKATTRQLDQFMASLLFEINSSLTSYDKTNVAILKNHFVPKCETAMLNAKKMHQTLIRDTSSLRSDGAPPSIWELKPLQRCTGFLNFY